VSGKELKNYSPLGSYNESDKNEPANNVNEPGNNVNEPENSESEPVNNKNLDFGSKTDESSCRQYCRLLNTRKLVPPENRMNELKRD